MATFRVGQRVKKIAEILPKDRLPLHLPVPIGSVGTVVRMNSKYPGYYVVQFDCDVLLPRTAAAYQVAPLTDPKAEQFLQSIRDIAADPMKPLPMEVEELARVRGGA